MNSRITLKSSNIFQLLDYFRGAASAERLSGPIRDCANDDWESWDRDCRSDRDQGSVFIESQVRPDSSPFDGFVSTRSQTDVRFGDHRRGNLNVSVHFGEFYNLLLSKKWKI